jgi:hypothetical protein
MNTKPTSTASEMLAAMAGGPDAVKSAMQRQADGFWQAQIQAIDAMQELASGWLQRRRDAAVAARAAVAAACASNDPLEALRAYQTWASGNVERLVADVMAIQSQMTAFAPLAAASLQAATRLPTAAFAGTQQQPRREAA